jgi:hypothetical protein
LADDRKNKLVSDETLKLYLLGSLPENERLTIDEQLLIDDEFAERMALSESVLIDEFVAKRLDSEEREKFVTRFLVTADRRQALQLSASLQDFAARDLPVAEIQVSGPSWREKLSAYFAFNSPRGWVGAGSLAILILVVGLIWFASRQREQNQLIAQNENPSVPSPTVAPSPITTPSPNATPSISQVPPDSPAPPTVASFVLLPGAVRAGGDMTRVVIPGGERDTVRLSLVLETPADGSYLAELVTAEGQKVLVRPNLKPVRNGQIKIVLTIPARVLHSRDYQIKLSHKSANGPVESVGRYYFRALEE